MYNHQCIKPTCSNSYESEEAEAYYCPDCTKANKALAEQIDAKAKRSTQVKTALQEYDEAQNKVGGFLHVRL
jgi:uncharacterized Zn ribbon protein